MEEIREMFEKLGVDYSMWLHGIDKGTLENKESIARSIMATGLNIPGNYSSILSTAVAAGRIGYEAYQSDVSNYRLGYGEVCNVVVAAPIFIENSSGEKIYLGSPDRNMHNTGQTREAQTVLDAICGRLTQVPREFIYGYYDEVSGRITPNENHYSNLSLEDRDNLFSKLKEGLERASFMPKDVNEAMINGNKEFFEKAKVYAQNRNGDMAQMMSIALKKFDEHYALIGTANNLRKEQTDLNLEEQSVFVERHRIQKEEPVQEQETVRNTTTIEQQEDLGNRFAEYEKSIPRGIFATRRALEKSKQEMLDALDVFSLDDISDVSSVNAYKIEKVTAIQKRLPQEFKADKLLEEKLEQKLDARMKFKVRRVITAKDVEERADILSSFDTTVAAFVFEGGRDVVTRFMPLVQKMNRAGMGVNLGRTVVGAGDKIVDRMAEIEKTEGRGSKAWNLLVDPVLNMYDISKDLGGEKWNTQEHKAFEDKLVKLGLVEISRDAEQPTPKQERDNKSPDKDNSQGKVLITGRDISDIEQSKTNPKRETKGPDKDDSQGKVSATGRNVREAEIQYVNTGMTPIGFKVDEKGCVVKETQLEEMRRKTAMQQNLAREREKYEQKNQENQQVLMGVNGQPIYNAPQKRVQQNRPIQNQQPQRKQQQGYEI